MSPKIIISHLLTYPQICLVQRLSMLKASPQAPFLEPSFIGTYATHESIKLRVETNPTLRLVIQVVMGVAPQWFRFGLQLGESSHLRVHLKRHVTFPFFRNVNILIHSTLGWPPLAFSPTSLLQPNDGINYFPIKRGPFALCLYVLNVGGITECVFHFHLVHSLLAFSLILPVQPSFPYFLKSILNLV